MSLEIKIEDPISAPATTLMTELTTELEARYGVPIRGRFTSDDIQHGGTFVVAWEDGEPIGCGGLRATQEPAIGELKRMYVRPAARGRRVGEAILRALEEAARGFGYHTLRLETAGRQPEAIRLYARAGFVVIPCYPPYAGQPWSRCFEKSLRPTT